MLLLTWLIHMALAEPDNSEDLKQAEEFFLNGQQLYNEQRYSAAVIAWKEGYEITKLPAFLKNIALAQEAMKEYSEALESLSIYRAYAPHEEQDALREWQENLEAQLEEQVALKEWHESLQAEKAVLEAQLQEYIDVADTTDVASTESNETLTVPKEAVAPETTRSSVWTIGAATGLIAASSILTAQAVTLQRDIESQCRTLDDLTLCKTTVSDLQMNLDSTQTIALVLWGSSALVSSVALWQISNQAALYATPTSLSIQGRF